MEKKPKHNPVPLAARMRPKTLEAFLGQEQILGEGSFLRDAILRDQVPSLIFWGPPGSGKTTLALLIAEKTQAEFHQLSAVGSGVKELRAIIASAEEQQKVGNPAHSEASVAGRRTILFIDEIHRWNKAQQDSLLPHVERGTLTLIGATTENPSFEVNGALLSRTRVLVLQKHEPEALAKLLEHALAAPEGLDGSVTADPEALTFIAAATGGDARAALNTLEAAATQKQHIDVPLVEAVLKRPYILYDKGGEEHYNIISALHKSVRGGDANAALYWLARMLEGGEDPLYVARRLVRMASEDIGLANSFALPQAVAAYQACQYLGMPECEVHLAQATAYLAESKKSNALYVGYGEAKKDVRKYPNEPVPLHIRNASTDLMKDLGYGEGYKYTPDYKDAKEAEQEYFPEKLKGRRYVRFSDSKNN